MLQLDLSEGGGGLTKNPPSGSAYPHFKPTFLPAVPSQFSNFHELPTEKWLQSENLTTCILLALNGNLVSFSIKDCK